MMRKAASLFKKRHAPARMPVVHLKSRPAPIGGWNARDPLAAMKPTDAVILENWQPRVADVVIRQGCADHVTGFAAKPKSLMLYTPPTGTNKMLAATDAGIFNASIAGALGASLKALTNGYLNWTQMGVSGGHYLCMFNGTDKPVFYEGVNFISIDAASVPAITGVTTTNLIAGHVYQRRLFMVEKNKLSFWYLPIDAIGGAALEFLLGPLCNKGGFLMAIGTWTIDGGSGPDDKIAFVTSEGEVIIFTGTDPSISTSWSLVGVYDLGAKPIGRKCFIKYGGDLVLITEFGALPLSKMLMSASIDFKVALSDKIVKAFTEAAASYGINDGWEAIVYPPQNLLIFNVPRGITQSDQYVMNTITRSWCKFTAWNAGAWAVFNKELYFADQTKIAKAFTARADYGLNITADAKTAYDYFGVDESKDWKLFRPQLLTDGNVVFNIGLSVDFQNNPPLATASYTVTAGAVWDAAHWDVDSWAAGLEIKQEWQTPSSYPGRCAAGLLRIATNSLEIQWAASDYIYEITPMGPLS